MDAIKKSLNNKNRFLVLWCLWDVWSDVLDIEKMTAFIEFFWEEVFGVDVLLYSPAAVGNNPILYIKYGYGNPVFHHAKLTKSHLKIPC